MVMKPEDVAYRRRLLDRWGHVCVICGYDFYNLACVTKEHVVPKSQRKYFTRVGVEDLDNIAPSHYTCNKLRGTDSIFLAVKIIEKNRLSMNEIDFKRWLNRKVTHRIVPLEAVMSLRPLAFMELPDFLPGM